MNLIKKLPHKIYKLLIWILSLIITPLWLLIWEMISIMTILILIITSIWIEDWRARIRYTASKSYLIQKLTDL